MHIDPAAVLSVISEQAQAIANLAAENARLREALAAQAARPE